jgi:hypothetical protein
VTTAESSKPSCCLGRCGLDFVEMAPDTAAQVASAGRNGTSLGGRPLTIHAARPQEDRGGPPRG